MIGIGGIESLRERLVKRGTENEEKMKRRLETAKKELQFAEKNPEFFDSILVNENFFFFGPLRGKSCTYV